MELEKTMAILCPQCIKKHPLKEFPLNIVEACVICEQTHATSSCPSLPGLKAFFQGASEENVIDQLYFMGQKKPWQPQPPAMNPGIFQDQSQYFNNFNMGPQYAPFLAM